MKLAAVDHQQGQASSDTILELARTRQEQAAGAYAGALTPSEAWTLFSRGAASLVDVRTAAELCYVGRVPGVQHVEWRGADRPAVTDFLAELKEQAAPGDTLMLLCRSAVRSHHAAAAATAAGWRQVFNVLEGFEGRRNPLQQRGAIDGWRHRGLPWIQD